MKSILSVLTFPPLAGSIERPDVMKQASESSSETSAGSKVKSGKSVGRKRKDREEVASAPPGGWADGTADSIKIRVCPLQLASNLLLLTSL